MKFPFGVTFLSQSTRCVCMSYDIPLDGILREALSPQRHCFVGQGREGHYKIMLISVGILCVPQTVLIPVYLMHFRPFCDSLTYESNIVFLLLCLLCSFFILSVNAQLGIILWLLILNNVYGCL